MNLVHPQESMPNFQAPTYSPLGTVAPRGILSALAPIVGAASIFHGGTPPAPPSGSYGPASQAFIQQYGTAPSVYLPQPTGISGGQPASIHSTAPPVTPTLGGLIAALAQQGQRVGSARPSYRI